MFAQGLNIDLATTMRIISRLENRKCRVSMHYAEKSRFFCFSLYINMYGPTLALIYVEKNAKNGGAQNAELDRTHMARGHDEGQC